MKTVNIGVLELQGDFTNHARAFIRSGASCVPIRRVEDFRQPLDGLVMPGGESTTMSILMHKWRLLPVLKTLIGNGMPVFATCAGSILVSRDIRNNHRNQPIVPLNVINLVVDRNGFGRQVDSFETEVEIRIDNKSFTIPGVFIRAPRFVDFASPVTAIGSIELDSGYPEVVAVQQYNIIALSFHPELTEDTTLQEYFIKTCRQWKQHLSTDNSANLKNSSSL